jgi:ankyrin repeat protein
VDTARGRTTLLDASLWRGAPELVAAVLALPGPAPLDALPAHGTWAWIRQAAPAAILVLLDAEGVDVRRPDADGRTALIELASAERAPDPALVRRLISAGGADDRAADGTNAFLHAALRRHLELAGDLLAAGADPNAASRLTGWTALIAAVAMGLDDVAGWLLTIPELDPDQAGLDGASALHHAAGLGPSAALAALLADPRVDPNRLDGAGRTALAVARLHGHPRAVELLQPRTTVTEAAPEAALPPGTGPAQPPRRGSIPHRIPPRQAP